jgi:hypothetical protein
LAVIIMAPHRLRFAHDDLLSATKQEEALAEETYVSYCGRYDFLGDRVVHHVELSLFPNWIGGDQERLVDLRGNRLTLSTRPLLPGSASQRPSNRPLFTVVRGIEILGSWTAQPILWRMADISCSS